MISEYHISGRARSAGDTVIMANVGGHHVDFVIQWRRCQASARLTSHNIVITGLHI
jgi:hypothetical protein